MSALTGRAMRLLLQEAARAELPLRLVEEVDAHLSIFEDSGLDLRKWAVSDWLRSAWYDVHREVAAMNDAGIQGVRWSAFYWTDVIVESLGHFANRSGTAGGLKDACDDVFHIFQVNRRWLCECVAGELRRLADTALGSTGAFPAILTPAQFLGTHAVLADALPAHVTIHLLSDLEARVVQRIAKNPEAMRQLPPRQFEAFIAELLRGLGWEVQLTARTRDGGRDVIAIKTSERQRLLVECKRYRS